MNIKKIEENVKNISILNQNNLEFIYNLLLAYGKPKTSITRLKSGTYNLSSVKNEVLWKNNLFFKSVEEKELHFIIDELKNKPEILRHKPRFIVITDYKQLLAIDTKTEETLDISINKLVDHFTFFLPWAGMEKKNIEIENIADIKAAERMAKLYDEIIKSNNKNTSAFYHSLNVFFARLLFCFFAEDTEVFNKGQFTSSISSYTQEDGNDLHNYLDELFRALDNEEKSEFPSHIKTFPYVNGGLFNKSIPSPIFNKNARQILLQCGELDWSQINPDIFGSMIQAVVHPGQRASLGMHYTSIENIMKVINPLFLENLHEEFLKSYNDENKLWKLLKRIYAIKVFDPACGSGNFLIIAYKELRKLEHQILKKIMENKMQGVKLNSWIKLENFYGIEIDDFAREIAILSLWLTKHQMNIEFKKKFGKDIPLIPLKDTGNIICGNATQLDWGKYCLVSDNDEVYLISNPPYAGSSIESEDQKIDKSVVFKDIEGYKNLDYVSCWYKKGADFIVGRNAELAFVSTNSICQGEQVSLIWPYLLEKLEIGFAYQSFKWTNNAKSNAGVTCIIVNLRNIVNKNKYIFINNLKLNAQNINPYLADGNNIIIYKRQKPISNLPLMSYGSKPVDGGYLILSFDEKEKLISQYPISQKYIKKLVGADEFINGNERWCLWITDEELENAVKIGPISERINNVYLIRSKSKKRATKDIARISHKFGEIRYSATDSVIVPSVTSENREYIPIGFLDKNSVVTNRAHVILNCPAYIFGIITSKMHMVWTYSVAGRLESRINYSSTICYNNFPVPDLSPQQQKMIENHVFEILDAREQHSEKTLAELYNPEKMPNDLTKAHKGLDEIVDLCYRSKPFENDEERLVYLFKLYEIMIATKKEKN